jgi:hypothetical protein
MVEEYDSIVKKNAWEIVPRPIDKSVVGSRSIYKVKQAVDGSVEKYKVRFVARGFSQIEGIHGFSQGTLSAYGLAHSLDGCKNCVPQRDN